MDLEEQDDDTLRDMLQEIDENDDLDVSSWEAQFIESICYTNAAWALTESQREKIIEIIERYD